MSAQQLVDELKQKHNETAILIGEHDMLENIVTVVYANLESGMYTVIEMNKNIGCVLSVGKNLKFNVSEPLKSKNNVY